MMKRKILAALTLSVIGLAAFAQTTENYLARYNALVSRVGFSGIGVETLLDKWESADPGDINQMVARFNYYLHKSSRDSVVVSTKARYLDMDPLFNAKDTSGVVKYYYNEKVYDPALFAKAISAIDKAIQFDNTRLDVYMMKVNTVISYEKETPDNSKDLILFMLGKYFADKDYWKFPDLVLTDDNFLEAVQDLCITYYSIGSPQAMLCFKAVSERVLKSRPKAVEFMNNMGAFYASYAKDDKKAMKYYSNALKLDPQNMVARQNVKLIQRRAAAAKAKK